MKICEEGTKTLVLDDCISANFFLFTRALIRESGLLFTCGQNPIYTGLGIARNGTAAGIGLGSDTSRVHKNRIDEMKVINKPGALYCH